LELMVDFNASLRRSRQVSAICSPAIRHSLGLVNPKNIPLLWIFV
jgi:hypothetical protein